MRTLFSRGAAVRDANWRNAWAEAFLGWDAERHLWQDGRPLRVVREARQNGERVLVEVLFVRV